MRTSYCWINSIPCERPIYQRQSLVRRQSILASWLTTGEPIVPRPLRCRPVARHGAATATRRHCATAVAVGDGSCEISNRSAFLNIDYLLGDAIGAHLSQRASIRQQ